MAQVEYTWNAILRDMDLPRGVYIIYDDDRLPIYVGKSTNPGQRLLEHVGRSKVWHRGVSEVGRFIMDNQPDSRVWKVTVYSEIGNEDIDDIEGKLIYELCPFFNAMGKKKQRSVTPQKYQPIVIELPEPES